VSGASDIPIEAEWYRRVIQGWSELYSFITKKNTHARIAKLSLLFKIIFLYTITSFHILARHWRQQHKILCSDFVASLGRCVWVHLKFCSLDCTIIGPNKWKSLGANSGLKGEWFTISQSFVVSVALNKSVVYGRVLASSGIIFVTASQVCFQNRCLHIIAEQVTLMPCINFYTMWKKIIASSESQNIPAIVLSVTAFLQFLSGGHPLWRHSLFFKPLP
jgi:hypothetical protein